MTTYAIGVHLKRNHIEAGLVNRDGKMVAHQALPSQPDVELGEICDQILIRIHEMIAQHSLSMFDIAGLGVGVAGVIHTADGTLFSSLNGDRWIKFPIRSFFEERIELPFLFQNDANVATLAEKWIGAAQENESFIRLQLDPKMDGGFFVNGDVVWGQYGNAMNLGFTTISTDGKTISELVSGEAIARRASALMKTPLTLQEVIELYQQNNKVITSLMEEVFIYLGMFGTMLIRIAEPEKIVIAGEVTQVGEPLFQAIQQHLIQYTDNLVVRATEIVPTQIAEHAGIIGAAALFLADVKG